MVLSDVEIWAELQAGRLIIDPLPSPQNIDSSSVDLTLFEEITYLPLPSDPRVQGVIISPSVADVMAQVDTYGNKEILSNGHTWIIDPGRLVIGRTREHIEIPNHLAAWVQGKSSLARMGLGVHVTAPTVQSGFRGRLVLEMSNIGPFRLELRSGMDICQLILEHVGLPSKQGYEGRYRDQE